MTSDLEAFADQQQQAQFRENQDIARRLRAVTAELGEVTADRNRLAKEHEALERVVSGAVNLTPKPDWLSARKANKGKRLVTLGAVLSDPHVGEVVRPEEMGGYNAYNLRIAEQRLKAYYENVVTMARDYLTGWEFEGIVHPIPGDIVSGSIHDELRDTDELSVLDSTLWAAERILAGIHLWAEHFGRVHVIVSPGNHGRDSQKPRYKRRNAHNADIHTARIMAMQASDPEITWHIPETIDADFTVYSTRFRAVHGEEYSRNNPGTSEIGFMGPVTRGTLRSARAKEAEGRPFDVNVVAHNHQVANTPELGIIANGTLKGYDEYARGLSLKPRPPEQAMFLVDPTHGPKALPSIEVLDRAAEGW